MDQRPTGVLLLAFGGPDSSEAIEPFMKNLMGGRIPPPPLVEKIKARYNLIGGKSPLPETTATQAGKLQDQLNKGLDRYYVEVGMRYWHPFIDEGVKKLMDKGVGKIVAVSLAPFYSKVSTGAYIDELNKVMATQEASKPEILIARPLYDNDHFLDAIAEKVTEALTEYSQSSRNKVYTIFSAHSLPVSYIESGDPYPGQFAETVRKVVERTGIENWCIAYQSKGGGQGEWLDPMVEDIMNDIKNRGFTDVLVVPAGFVSDHIETLYDIDIAQKNHADSLGLKFKRTSSLNTSGLFIRALADLVEEKIS